jgi:hypothetical protein
MQRVRTVKCSIGGGISSPSTRMWYFSLKRRSCSSVRSRIYRGGLQLQPGQSTESLLHTNKSYLVFNGSVYEIPFANSISEASFLRLLIASSISASASCAFSVSVLLESMKGWFRCSVRAIAQDQLTFSRFLGMHLLSLCKQSTLLSRLLPPRFFLSLCIFYFIQGLLCLLRGRFACIDAQSG